MPRAEHQTIATSDAASDGVGLVVANLLNELAALGALLEQAARGRWWLDAFLVAAGINQIAEDWLHDSPYPFDDAASFLAGSGSRTGRVPADLGCDIAARGAGSMGALRCP